MFTILNRRSAAPAARRRRCDFRLRVESLESRNLMTATLTALNFNATVTSVPVVIKGEMFFSATDSVHGSQLWESDGTAGGTTMLTSINTSHGGLNPKDLTAVGSTLYFTATDGKDGLQLWSSTGSSTVMVTDANPGLGLFPQDLTNVNGTLYLVGYNASDGYQIYTSNGTSGGTVMVADINGSHGSGASNLAAVGSTLFFSANDGVHGTQLWESNGTSSGTVMVADINGTTGSYPTLLTAVGNTLFFDAYDSTHGIELWTSNGTSSGTVLVKDIDPGNGSSLPSDLTNVNGTLFFVPPMTECTAPNSGRATARRAARRWWRTSMARQAQTPRT